MPFKKETSWSVRRRESSDNKFQACLNLSIFNILNAKGVASVVKLDVICK